MTEGHELIETDETEGMQTEGTEMPRLPRLLGGKATSYMKLEDEDGKKAPPPFTWIAYVLVCCILVLLCAMTLWAAAWFVKWAPL